MTIQPDFIKAAFPSFAIDAALENLGGNAMLLHKVITSFHQQYHETAHNEITTLINNKEITNACQFAHTIKGLAGTIGDKELQEKALSLECACRENDEQKITETFSIFADQIIKSLLDIGAGLEKIAAMEATTI